MLLELIKGVALLLSLCLLQGFNVRLCQGHKVLQQIIAGLLFGGITVIGMMVPVHIAEGVIFDARTVILIMAGLFGGPAVAISAGLIAGIYRFWLGGGGYPVGLATIIASVLLGLAYRRICRAGWIKNGPIELLLFGFVTHVIMVLIFTQLPASVLTTVMHDIALPYVFTFSLGTMILGLMMQDIVNRTNTEQALHASEARLRAIVQAIPDLMVIIDEDGHYIDVLPSTNHQLYEPALALIGKTLHSELPQENADKLLATVRDSIRLQQTQTIEYERDGVIGRRLVEGRAQPLGYTVNDKQVVVFLARDITDRKIKEDEIAYLAFYDPLTDLPNRRLLQDRLHQAMANSKRSGQRGALLFIDLDNFKTLNDTLGHDKGDLLLQQVATRIAECVRECDTVARLGGDEFVVMLEELSHIEEVAAAQAKMLGEKILVKLRHPYLIAGYEHNSSASIGITLFQAHQESSDELMKRADIAMYQAKSAGRNTLRFFDNKMQAIITSRAELENDLREGIRQQQLQLHYQPQVDANGQITGAEALVRWQHPLRGMISPAEFIPLAEESGLILALGDWVLYEACQQLRRWTEQPALAHLSLAVNISARQIHQPDFVDQILATIHNADITPGSLKLELTESLLLEDTEDIIHKMTALKACGVGFSLDDFGTGYSSLAYLKRLPLDQLKIDQSFVRDLLTDPNDAAIASTIVTLAQSMGLNVIAEGVETEAQRQRLEELGCYAYQGYLFGRPAPAEMLSVTTSEKIA
ncbi:MAG: EAL domain-containing protein [Tolumonas sp.]|nr:EAL domain-containing protein [Tolumonas sp.]